MHDNVDLPFHRWRQRHPVLEQIGNTPLIELTSMLEQPDGDVRLLGKAEWLNASGSVKARPALGMICGAIDEGELSEDQVILDATSGNTGIAYATIGAALGYSVTLCLPENSTPERKTILRSLGAELVLTDPSEEMDGAIRRATQMAEREPDRYYYPDQYGNDRNWQSHYCSTGPEIWRDTEGEVTHFVAGLGTTGTFVGTSRRLKTYSEQIRTISFQPATALHGLEGLKHLETACVPGIYDPECADRDITIRTKEAVGTMKELAEQQGLFMGPSGAAAVCAAKNVAEELDEGTVVTILPDSGDKYMGLWNEVTDQTEGGA